MPKPVRITSPGNPRIKRVVKLRNHRDRRKAGLFIAEGAREVSRAAAAGLHVRELFVSPELLVGVREGESAVETWQRAADEVGRACPGLGEDVGWLSVPPPVFRKMAYLREPEGLLAVVDQPSWTLEALPAVTGRTLYLVAVGIEKPGNLGAMVRTAEAAGCDAVLAADSPGDVFNPNAIRASTCAVFALPTVAAPSEAIVNWLADKHVRVMAATPRGAVAHTAADWQGPVAVAIGAEDVGLDKAWLNAADRSGGQRVLIPMRGRLVDSLNASAAAAVLLFEARRALGAEAPVG
ncbi:MAG: TrmH family RNA methyltransferase [Phycisphaeraceae bacterium]